LLARYARWGRGVKADRYDAALLDKSAYLQLHFGLTKEAGLMAEAPKKIPSSILQDLYNEAKGKESARLSDILKPLVSPPSWNYLSLRPIIS
jgi:hypothetical protein